MLKKHVEAVNKILALLMLIFVQNRTEAV